MRKENQNAETVLRVQGLYKKFCKNLKRSMLYGIQDLLGNFFSITMNRTQLRRDEFWSLQNVNFELRRGEVLGIIGPNGAGKSTLLRILNGIFPPDQGVVEFSGRIGGLIALGAGFHPHMTGRENIFLNGTILGMTRAEIDEKIDDIIEFSEIGEFIDAPVSTYSSGMNVRLGFAIAIHTRTDIFLIDEILSVGDWSFQNKCIKKISDLIADARAVIFVGHNMDTIRRICNRAILLEHGKIVREGSPEEVANEYLSKLSLQSAKQLNRERGKARSGPGLEFNEGIVFKSAGVLGADGTPVTEINAGQEIKVFCDFEVLESISDLRYNVAIRGLHDQNYVFSRTNIARNDVTLGPTAAGKSYRLSAHFRRNDLSLGVYEIIVGILRGETGETVQVFARKDAFRVIETSTFFSLRSGSYHNYSLVSLSDDEVIVDLEQLVPDEIQS